MLNAARQSGDRSAEATALADLGALALNQGEVPQAIARLEEALALAQTLPDRSRETDVLGNLGLALLSAGQVERAQQLLDQELAQARRLWRCNKASPSWSG